MSYMVQQCITGFLVLLYSLAVLVPSCHSATNLALGKSYTVSPLPSYRLSAPPTDRTSLTDGKYTKGHFWVEKTTVGWHPVPAVEILIDLEKVSIIDGITFNTARGDYAGVFYPAQIHAFVGPDLEHLMHIGDIADHPDNVPGAYRTKRFQLDGIQAKGRYVLLEIVSPISRSVFCDEIEVLEGNQDSGKTGSLSVEAARQFSKRLKWGSIEKKLLDGFLAESQVSPGDRKTQADRIATPKQKQIYSTSVYDDGGIDSRILAARADVLRRKSAGSQLLVESVNPWSHVSPLAVASGKTSHKITLETPQGGYGHAALMVTNLAPDAREIATSFTKMPAGTAELLLHQVPFVKSTSLEYVADPLVPEQGLTLRPGESGVIFISAQGDKPGKWTSTLKIDSVDSSISIPVEVTVSDVTLPEKLSLNAVNWGYLDFSLVRDRKKQAAQDLHAHHTDVVVVPPNYLPGANQLKQAGLQDFLRLESYLKYHQGATKVLLGIGFGSADRKTVTGKFQFLSTGWKDGFKRWYANTLLATGRAGYTENQIYLYPYDEIAGAQIDDFVRLAYWTKNEIPTIKFYATFGDETRKGKQWHKVLPYLDIVQASADEMLVERGQSKAEAWIYDTAGMSRSLSPYSYYRLMSWKAFLRGYTGVGFWAYADIGDKDTTAWKELDRDYSVIYEGPGSSIISSRRWEAWRMGIEDYELLTMYAKAKGLTAAKDLAAAVFNHPEDTTKADEVRHKILTELSAISIPPAPAGSLRFVK